MNNSEGKVLKTFKEWNDLGYSVKFNEKPIFINNNNNKKMGFFSIEQVVRKNSSGNNYED